MRKHFPLIAALLMCMLCLALSGCASLADTVSESEEATAEEYENPWMSYYSVDPELEKLNYDLEYTTAYYDYPNELYDDSDSSETFHNLTNTQIDSYQLEELAIGWKILASKEELAAFEQTIEDVEAAALESIQQYSPSVTSYKLVTFIQRTAVIEYDEAFFQEHALLLIDLCKYCSGCARFYPENLTVNGDSLSIDLRWDCDNAWEGSSSGQYCLIVIPAGCTNAELNIRQDFDDT